ncbi:tRNA (guanine-N(1)-)-methyltransferase [BD1-7 clade bacterium]|uniref:tRNA (guanine-N(1)-)-methyltransferase n=1 Tax=BD1-7 clade bacterium TaxID=2029982 RepID=A0A5S9N8S0_9GAMM|nr:tRNA (guanine-N(1)-)-methyltransferase [BD1-7 clade bacterium]
MKFGVVTLFPPMLEGITQFGITSRAVKKGLISVDCWNPRDFTQDRHRTVDDRPYGGGPGMVMMIEPLRQAIHTAKQELVGNTQDDTDLSENPPKVVYLSPQGQVFNQAKARELASESALILVAGRYEGIDQRLIDYEIDEEISIGDFVVSGGELPAMMVIDAIARCLPDVLGHSDSAVEDSFFEGLLDHPHFTRPEEDLGGHDSDGEIGAHSKCQKVPEVLLSGNHELIRVWRLKQALGQTWLKRPDLLTDRCLTDEEQRLLAEFQQEWQTLKEHL